MTREEHNMQEEEEQEEFCEQTILLSYKQGTEYRQVVAHMYRDSGLGYWQLERGTFQIILESGYTLCPYALPTSWQIEEACRRIAPCANYKMPAAQIFPAYRQEHSGEKLGKVLETVLLEVYALAELLKVLQDWLLERGDSSDDQLPLLAF